MTLDEKDGRYPSIYPGYVRRNDDPEKRGRLMLYVPFVMGEEDLPDLWVGWAEPCLPWLGGTTTAMFGVPPTKAQAGGKDACVVWVMFQNADPDHPVWMGCAPIAPTPDLGASDPTTASTPILGAAADSPPTGSDLSELDPMQVTQADRSTGSVLVLAEEGRDVVIMSPNGGSLLIGPSGVSINGPVLINGTKFVPSTTRRTV